MVCTRRSNGVPARAPNPPPEPVRAYFEPVTSTRAHGHAVADPTPTRHAMYGKRLMRLVFVDDSEQTNPARRGLGPLLALGAVLVSDDEVGPYASDLAAIRSELGMPSSEEIKWKPPRGSFLAGTGGQLVSTLRRRMLEAAIQHGIKSAVVIIDHGKSYKNQSKGEVGREALKWLYERVSMHLESNRDNAIVVADKPGGGSAQESRWLAETLTLTSYGTEYVKPVSIVMPIVTAPSHHVPHLQLADLVVAATTAAVAGHPQGLELAPLLLRLAHKNTHGLAGGAGIVLWPAPELINLLYWAFGETTYAKVAMNTGWTLPWRTWPYATNSGI